MDANKREVLVEIGYRVLPTCGRCFHGDIAPGSEWGTCAVQTYGHLKHTGLPRALSITRSGTCQRFALNPTEALGGFEEFA
jgi:hypothetical protein